MDTGISLNDVNGFKAVCKLLWDQTWPLFAPPHLLNMLLLCYMVFSLFFVAHGIYVWYL